MFAVQKKFNLLLLFVLFFGINSSFANESFSQDELLPKVMEAEFTLFTPNQAKAVRIYEKLNSQYDSPQIAQQLTFMHTSITGDKRKAAQAAARWAKLDPNSIEAKTMSAYLNVSLGELKVAKTYIEQIAMGKENAHMELIGIYQELRDEKGKNNLLLAVEELAKQHPKNKSLAIGLVEIYAASGWLQQALFATQNLLVIDSKYTYAIKLHAQLQIHLGRSSAAINFLQDKVEALPDNKELIAFYIDTLNNNTMFEQANKALNKQKLQLDNYTTEEIISLAKMSMRSSNTQLAKEFLARAMENNDGYKAKFVMAHIAELEGHHDTALNHYKDIPRGKLYMQANLRHARLLVEQGNAEAAIMHLDAVYIDVIAEQKEVDSYKAQLLHNTGKHEEAVALLSDSMHIFPEDKDLLMLRSANLMKSMQWKAAISDLEYILNKHPNDVEALSMMAYIHTEHLQNYSAAKNYLSKAMKIDPENPAVLSSAGWLYHKTGNNDKAVEFLTSSISKEYNVDTASHLGDVLINMGKTSDALTVIQEALQLSPNHRRLNNTMDTLKGSVRSLSILNLLRYY